MASTRQAKLAAQAKKDALLLTEVSRALLQSYQGRRWLWLQLEFAQCFSEDANLDPGVMAWNKGRRNFGLKLYQEFSRVAPDLFLLMTRENTGTLLTGETPVPEDEEELSND